MPVLFDCLALGNCLVAGFAFFSLDVDFIAHLGICGDFFVTGGCDYGFHHDFLVSSFLVLYLGVLGLFAALQVLFLIVLNASPGHLVTGLRLVPINPAPLGLWRPIVRTALLCLVVPALIADADQRGLHDRVAATVLVRR